MSEENKQITRKTRTKGKKTYNMTTKELQEQINQLEF
jgi:hypothetical protein